MQTTIDALNTYQFAAGLRMTRQQKDRLRTEFLRAQQFAAKEGREDAAAMLAWIGRWDAAVEVVGMMKTLARTYALPNFGGDPYRWSVEVLMGAEDYPELDAPSTPWIPMTGTYGSPAEAEAEFKRRMAKQIEEGAICWVAPQ